MTKSAKRPTVASLTEQLDQAQDAIRILQQDIRDLRGIATTYTILAGRSSEVLGRIAKFFQITPFNPSEDNSEDFMMAIMDKFNGMADDMRTKLDQHETKELELRAQIAFAKGLITESMKR